MFYLDKMERSRVDEGWFNRVLKIGFLFSVIALFYLTYKFAKKKHHYPHSIYLFNKVY